MNVFIRLAIAACSLMAVAANAANEEAIAKATGAATSWLVLTDAGDGAISWKAAASLFQAGVPQKKWEQSLAAAREPLGALKGRKVLSAKYSRTLPGARLDLGVIVKVGTVACRDCPERWRDA